MVIQTCKDIDVYNLAFKSAMNVFEMTKSFPKEEMYGLVTQIRRSSRSVPANIREGFAKRRYPDVFVRHLNDALGSSEETVTWLDFSYSCKFLDSKNFQELNKEYEAIGAMLFKLMKNWQKF